MPIEVVNFWRKCPLDGPRFVHPEDWPYLQRHRNLIRESSFEGFMRNPGFDDPALHLSLRPQPYCGDLQRAKIFILLLNPGLGYSDYWGEFNDARLTNRLERTLHQEFEGTEFPFFWLDPALCYHGGSIWWEKKLRGVIREIATRYHKDCYSDARRDLSNEIASLELLPYHSSVFGAHRLINKLPSVGQMKKFVEYLIYPSVVNDPRTLIATRRSKDWGLTRNSDRLIIYKGGHTRGASLGPDTEGGKAILAHFASRRSGPSR